jgi:hypothetical protein
MAYRFARATDTDTDAVVGLLADRARWLAKQGLDQWVVKDPARTTAATIAAGETWLLWDDFETPVATITLSTIPDRDFWTLDEAAVPALYGSKLATKVAYAGARLGEITLYAAFWYASRYSIGRIRGDVWRDNLRLLGYHLSTGATHLRTMEVPGRHSGALIEWGPATHKRVWESGLLDWATIDATTGPVAAVESVVEPGTSIIGVTAEERHSGSGGSIHQHVAMDLWYADGQPVRLSDSESARHLMHHTGDGWRINGRLVDGPALAQLRPGLPYDLRHTGPGGECRLEVYGDLLNGALQRA